ncbi:MAG TPA: hypothetical protein PLT80_00630 [Candidatus Syntrophosphaera thermopropionivorans]|nr:hypothetical protein [Candidatus Syntrophosphaera thermopropionivorans]
MPETGISNLLPVNPEINLVFTKHNDNPVTIIWDRGDKISFNRWYLAWEINLNKIYKQKIPKSATMRVYIDFFKNALDVRNLALNPYAGKALISPTLDLVINYGNLLIARASLWK